MTKYSRLTFSLIAFAMVACAAHADIASSAYVDTMIDPVETKIDNHVADTSVHVTATEKSTWSGKQDALGYTAENVANKETQTVGYDTTSDTKYPTTKVVNQMIIDSKADINGTLTDLGNNKQNKIPAGTAGNVLTYTGTPGSVGSLGFDNAPTANSTNLVKSGAIKTALDAKQDTIPANTYDAYGAATGVQNAIEGKLDDGAAGYDIDAKSLKVQGAAVLTSHQDISGKLDKNAAITGATKTKITYDANGLVTAGADLAVADLPADAIVGAGNVTVDRNANNAASNPNAYTISVASASTSAKGVIEIATDTEASTGTDTTRAVTPKQLATKQIKSTAEYQMGNASGGWTAMTADQQSALNSGATTTNIGKIGTGTISAMGSDGTTAATDLVAAVNAIDSRLATTTTTASGAVQEITTGATNGTISVDGTDVAVKGLKSGAYADAYSLPIATSSVLGGVKQGTNVSINSSTGVISVSDAGTNTKGVMKLQTTTGSGTDGTMTQKAITDQLATKQDKFSVPTSPSTEGVYVLTAKVTGEGSSATTTLYWEDIGR